VAPKVVITKMVKEFTASENKWLNRIILKDLKIGFKHERLLKAFHPDAIELYNMSTNLERVCWDCRLVGMRVDQTCVQPCGSISMCVLTVY
jgi:DNA ligase-4